MRYRIWMLVLVVLASLVSPSPAAPYTLKVTFEGLVGYVVTTSNVWALLPNADPACQPPPYADTSDANVYPRHYAVLIVPGKNVRPSIAGNLQIPIEGYDLVLPSGVSGGTGMDLTSTKFRQRAGDGVTDASVDKLAAGMLDATPAKPDLLAARMKLPSTGFAARESNLDFKNVNPKSPVGGFCDNTTMSANPVDKRIESVTWTSSSLSADIRLTLRPFKGAELFLLLGPASGESTFEIKVVNKVAEAFIDPAAADHHWAAYRWFYNLSTSGTDCTKHYYPNGPFGGDRCPQKLYTE